MVEAKTELWGAESVARRVEHLYLRQMGNKAAPLELLPLEGKASRLCHLGSASLDLGQCQSKLGRESLLMDTASSMALKNGSPLALWEAATGFLVGRRERKLFSPVRLMGMKGLA